MILQLQRETLSPATLGRLSIDGAPECDTLERPWLDNQPEVSCIPPGVYPLTIAPSLHFERDMIRLGDTGTRKGILIHAANRVDELKGCIALGKRLHTDQLFESRLAVLKVQMKIQIALSRGEVVTIEIRNPEVSV